MDFLHVNECVEWCREHGATIRDPWTLMPDPALTSSPELLFAPQGSIGREPEVADLCLAALSGFDEVLIWVDDWGIWPSSEDWPRFYAARGARGERHALEEKPGHLFAPTDHDDLRLFLLIVLEQGWDAHVLAWREGSLAPRIWLSHDGWAQLHALQLTAFELSAA